MKRETYFIREFQEIITTAIPHDGREGYLPVLVLTHLHLHGPSTSHELEQALGVPQPAISRSATFLREGSYRGRRVKHAWIGSLRSRHDPSETRRYVHSITKKGNLLLSEIAQPMLRAAGSVVSDSLGL